MNFNQLPPEDEKRFLWIGALAMIGAITVGAAVVLGILKTGMFLISLI